MSSINDFQGIIPMDYPEQRQLAAKLFPQHAEVILDKDNCFLQIVRHLGENGITAQDFTKEMPSVWAYWWAYKFPEDKEWMKQFITRSYWACNWAIEFPEDKEYMKQFITESGDAYLWSCKFPEDKEYMSQFFL